MARGIGVLGRADARGGGVVSPGGRELRAPWGKGGM